MSAAPMANPRASWKAWPAGLVRVSDTTDEATDADPYDRGMRSAAQRRADAERRLENDANVWIATSSNDGTPHLVPVSLGWDGTQILVATPSATPTARNADETDVEKRRSTTPRTSC